jgi:DedD protein
MSDLIERRQGEKGLSAGVLAVVFLIWAAVSAVFFSLGFIVGHNEETRAEPVTERVAPPSAVPPLVNPASQGASSSGPEGATTSAGPENAAQPETERVSAPQPTPKPARPNARARETPVRNVAAPQERATETANSPGNPVRTGLAVQVDALRAKQDAEALVRILKARRYPVFLVTPEYANSKDNLYRVQVGPFATREEAEKARDKLAQEGFKPFIRH